MSTRSQFAFSALDQGIPVVEATAVWQGSVVQCWNVYVQPFAETRDRLFPCDVYWISATIGSERFFKIGISKNVAKRFSQFEKTFPIAEWKMVNVVKTKDFKVAERCEADMLVACRRLHVGGEWMRSDDFPSNSDFPPSPSPCTG